MSLFRSGEYPTLGDLLLVVTVSFAGPAGSARILSLSEACPVPVPGPAGSARPSTAPARGLTWFLLLHKWASWADELHKAVSESM